MLTDFFTPQTQNQANTRPASRFPIPRRIRLSEPTTSKPSASWLQSLTETSTDNQFVVLSDDLELAQAAENGDERAFLEIARRIDWTNRPANEVVRGVRLALQVGAHGLARQLSQEGGRRFPEHAEMQQLAHLLAPARVIQSNLPPDPHAGLDMRWLKQHGDEYRGQWVALDHGKLLGAAPTYKELAQKIGSPIGKNILVTPVY